MRWWSSIRRWRPSRSPSSRWCRRSLMGKGRRRPSSSWWRWISKGRRRGAGSSLSRFCRRSWGVIVGGRQIFLQRIQEEEGDILHLGVPRPRQRTEVEKIRRKSKPSIYKELNLSKMKMWTKCPISRLPNLGVGLFVAQQVNSDSQIVFRRQNILVCAQNVNESKK